MTQRQQTLINSHLLIIPLFLDNAFRISTNPKTETDRINNFQPTLPIGNSKTKSWTVNGGDSITNFPIKV